MSDAERRHAENLIRRANEAGVELYLWRKRVYWPKESAAPADLKSEMLKHSAEVKDALTRRYVLERAEANRSHKWVIRLGDDARVKDSVPALLACGPATWHARLMRQVPAIGSEGDAQRWLVLDQDHVGALFVDERGILVATTVVLPDGVKLGGRKGALAEVVSACASCATPAVADEKVNEIVENDKD